MHDLEVFVVLCMSHVYIYIWFSVVHPTSNGSSVTSSFPTIASTIDRGLCCIILCLQSALYVKHLLDVAGNLSSFPGSDVPGTFCRSSSYCEGSLLYLSVCCLC